MRIKPRKGIRNVNKSFYVLFVFYFLMFYALPFSGLHLASHALSSTSLFSLSFFLCFSSDLLVSLFCFLLSSVPPIRSSLHSTHLHLFPIWFMSVLLFMFIFTPWQLLSITLFLFNHYFCWKNLIFLVSFHKCFLFRLYSIDSSFHFPFFIPVFFRLFSPACDFCDSPQMTSTEKVPDKQHRWSVHTPSLAPWLGRSAGFLHLPRLMYVVMSVQRDYNFAFRCPEGSCGVSCGFDLF